jgi:SAM-dependent methyltransferase
VPILLELVRPRSVVDVGCGSGAWLSVFAELGVKDLLGIDAHGPIAINSLPREDGGVPGEAGRGGPDGPAGPLYSYWQQDLDTEVRLDRKFDLAVCLEVAEHLHPDSAATIVTSLANLAPVVLFSAAVPMQGGTQHVNEQWPTYWSALFARQRFAVLDPIRRQVWNREDVAWWYAQNALLYVRKDELRRRPELKGQARITCPEQLDLVHPRMLSRLTPKPEVLDLAALLRSQVRLLMRAPRAAARAVLTALPSRGKVRERMPRPM